MLESILSLTAPCRMHAERHKRFGWYNSTQTQNKLPEVSRDRLMRAKNTPRLFLSKEEPHNGVFLRRTQKFEVFKRCLYQYSKAQ